MKNIIRIIIAIAIVCNSFLTKANVVMGAPLASVNLSANFNGAATRYFKAGQAFTLTFTAADPSGLDRVQFHYGLQSPSPFPQVGYPNGSPWVNFANFYSLGGVTSYTNTVTFTPPTNDNYYVTMNVISSNTSEPHWCSGNIVSGGYPSSNFVDSYGLNWMGYNYNGIPCAGTDQLSFIYSSTGNLSANFNGATTRYFKAGDSFNLSFTAVDLTGIDRVQFHYGLRSPSPSPQAGYPNGNPWVNFANFYSLGGVTSYTNTVTFTPPTNEDYFVQISVVSVNPTAPNWCGGNIVSGGYTDFYDAYNLHWVGYNFNGIPCAGTDLLSFVYSSTAQNNWQERIGSSQHTCIVTLSGGVKCWGNEAYGQVGDGSAVMTQPNPVDVTGLTSGVQAVSNGVYHTCALTFGGGVKCWGYGLYGQLGNGSTTNQSTPVDVSGLGSGVVAIASGKYHTCALTSAGGVKCWGYGGWGQLGNGANGNQSTPVDVSGLSSGVTAIAAGGGHTCALMSGGGVKCWGRNAEGELGNNSTTSQNTPVDASGLGSGVLAISTGELHTCVVTSTGGAKCWGANAYGQIGNGNTTTQLTAVDVSGLSSGVAVINAGLDTTCAVTTSGGAKCWGYNAYGQTGNGNTTSPQLAPVDVVGLTGGVKAITGKFYTTCALTSAGQVKCWGHNQYGQIGNGNTTSPQLVPFSPDATAPTVSTSLSAGGVFSATATDGSGVGQIWCKLSTESVYSHDGSSSCARTPTAFPVTFSAYAVDNFSNSSTPVTQAVNSKETVTYDPNNGKIATRATNGTTSTYSYDTAHPFAVASANGRSYSYDLNGNAASYTVAAATTNLVYDPENRLVEMSGGGVTGTNRYAYDGNGTRRISLEEGHYAVDVSDSFEVTLDSLSCAAYSPTYPTPSINGEDNFVTTVADLATQNNCLHWKSYISGSGAVVERVQNGGTAAITNYTLLQDNLGSTSKVVDASRNVTTMRYGLWGNSRDTATLPTDLGYTGQEKSSTGLYFYNSRWYDGASGRFLQADSIVPDAYNPLDLDRYSYVRNNSANYNDPSGHLIPFLLAAGVIALVALVVDRVGGASPDLRGISIAESAMDRSTGSITVAAGIAVQAEYYSDFFDSRDYKDPKGTGASLGIAKVSDEQMEGYRSKYGLQGDQQDPKVAVQAMSYRIKEVQDACVDCKAIDKLIAAALAQNGSGFTAKSMEGVKMLDNGYMDWEGEFSTNWTNPKTGFTHFREQVSGGLKYDTRFMLHIYTNDLMELYRRGWSLPDDITIDDLYKMENLARTGKNVEPISK